MALQAVAGAEASGGYALLALKLAIECASVGRVNSELQEHIDADAIALTSPWRALEQSLGDPVIARAR